uniref:Uncharacterized protein n=1 Tax=Arion vulgaris TaxID=1028688 RepID=A0A0B7ACQ5_9EUPU
MCSIYLTKKNLADGTNNNEKIEVIRIYRKKRRNQENHYENKHPVNEKNRKVTEKKDSGVD